MKPFTVPQTSPCRPILSKWDILEKVRPYLSQLPMETGITDTGCIGITKTWGLKDSGSSRATAWRYRFPIQLDGDSLPLRPLCGLRHHLTGGGPPFVTTQEDLGKNLAKALAQICIKEDIGNFLLSNTSTSSACVDEEIWTRTNERLGFKVEGSISEDLSTITVTSTTAILNPTSLTAVPHEGAMRFQATKLIGAWPGWPDMTKVEGIIVEGRQKACEFWELCLVTADSLAKKLPNYNVRSHPDAAWMVELYPLNTNTGTPLLRVDCSPLILRQGPATIEELKPVAPETLKVIAGLKLRDLSVVDSPKELEIGLDLV